MFSRRADDLLRVLIHHRVIVLIGGIFVFVLNEAAANLDRVQLIRSDAPEQDHFAAGLGIEIPFPTSFHDRDGQRPVVIADQERGAIRVLRIHLDRMLFLGLGHKLSRAILVLDCVLGCHKVIASWT